MGLTLQKKCIACMNPDDRSFRKIVLVDGTVIETFKVMAAFTDNFEILENDQIAAIPYSAVLRFVCG